MPPSPLSAALAAAAAHGLPTRRARVVRDVTNVLVHLAPAPVVARVPVTFPRLRPRAWFAQETALAQFLVSEGAPVVPPATEVDPGPHEQDGFLVGFWAHVDHDPARSDPTAAGRSLCALHSALERYPEELPAFDRLDEVRELLSLLRPSELVSSGELAGLRGVAARLAEESIPAGRPLHGDAHLGNVLWSPEGPLWTDLENVCSGPIEYDLACIAWRGAPGSAEALSAYGEFDARLVERVTPFLVLFLAAWTLVVVERVPTEGGRAEARRRIEAALRCGQALPM